MHFSPNNTNFENGSSVRRRKSCRYPDLVPDLSDDSGFN